MLNSVFLRHFILGTQYTLSDILKYIVHPIPSTRDVRYFGEQENMEDSKKNTLIVEDSITFRQFFREILLSRFPLMQVHEAADVPEALKKVEAFPPDLAIVDIRLPGENGLALAKILKSQYPNLKVIILTMHDTPEYREAARQLGTDYFISKGSSTKEEILTLIRSVLS